MPAREHRAITVEPTDAEVERQRLMWRYFQRLPELTRELNLELIAQRVIRSASSLKQRVTYLTGHGHEREGLLAEVDPLLDRSLGDSRFEALVDLLGDIWRLEAGERVLVAAGDNLSGVPQFDGAPCKLFDGLVSHESAAGPAGRPNQNGSTSPSNSRSRSSSPPARASRSRS